jgi:hypothetical protein
VPETTTEVDQGTNGQDEALTPKQLARLLKSDARTVRKFLRVQYGKVGQGNRWGLDHEDLDAFVKAWGKWRAKIEAKAKAAEIETPEGETEDEMEVDG